MTDTYEDMVRILITDDSQAKFKVARQLEPWSSIALNEFSLDGTAYAVMLIGWITLATPLLISRWRK